MKTSSLLAALLVVPLLQPAFAADGARPAPPAHKRYIGLDFANSSARGGLSGSESTESSTGFALRFGYQFNRYLAAEIGYADFGDFTFEYRPDSNSCPGRPPGGCDIDTNMSLSGPFINVVGILPLSERWALKGRAGIFRASVESLDSGPGAPTSPPPSRISDTNSGLHFGAGVSYLMTEHLEFELSWTYFEQIGLGLNVGGSAVVFDEGSSSLASIGLAYRF